MRLSHDKRNSKNSHNRELQHKGRAASSSLNRKGEDRFLFRPPVHGSGHNPTPKNRNHEVTSRSKEDSRPVEITTKIKREYLQKNEKDMETTSKTKRSSLHRVKKVNKIPLGKRDLNSNNVHRSTSRSKQLSAKNRLVYKKDSRDKVLNPNNIKNEVSAGMLPPSGASKHDNKENDFSQANTNIKLNRTSSGRDTQKNMKSVSGIKKLYTLKANSSSSRRLESQSYRDLNYKHKPSETMRNEKTRQANIHHTMNNKKRHSKNKNSSSETPKLRSYNETLFAGLKGKVK